MDSLVLVLTLFFYCSWGVAIPFPYLVCSTVRNGICFFLCGNAVFFPECVALWHCEDFCKGWAQSNGQLI